VSTRLLRFVLPLALLLPIAPVDAAGPLQPRPALMPGAPTLMLDGVVAGSVQDVHFPFASSDVVSVTTGTSYFVKKHIGNIKYEDVSMLVGSDVSRPMLDWMSGTIIMNYQRKNGALTIDGRQHEFFNALVTEIGFPALESGGSNKGFLSVKFAPEYTRVTKASSKFKNVASPPTSFSTSSFLVEIDGLATGKIVRVDAFTIKQTATTDELGDARDYLKEPGKLEFPNLALYVAPGDATGFTEWHEDFVIKGNCDESNEKSGRIVLRNESSKDAVEIKLFNVGIFGMDEVMVGNKKLRRIDLYVERMELGPAGGLEGAGAPTAPTKPGKVARRPGGGGGGADLPKRIVGKRKPLPGKPNFGKVPKM